MIAVRKLNMIYQSGCRFVCTRSDGPPRRKLIMEGLREDHCDLSFRAATKICRVFGKIGANVRAVGITRGSALLGMAVAWPWQVIGSVQKLEQEKGEMERSISTWRGHVSTRSSFKAINLVLKRLYSSVSRLSVSR